GGDAGAKLGGRISPTVKVLARELRYVMDKNERKPVEFYYSIFRLLGEGVLVLNAYPNRRKGEAWNQRTYLPDAYVQLLVRVLYKAAKVHPRAKGKIKVLQFYKDWDRAGVV